MTPELMLQHIRPALRVEYMSARHMAVLLRVHIEGGSFDIGLCGHDLGICKPAVSRVVDFLDKLGFVYRKRNAVDRRKVFINITEAGSGFIHSLMEAA